MNIPAKIRRMSKRRQKIALKKRIQVALRKFVGQPNSPLVRADINRAIMHIVAITK
jgi:hypothetical protein